MHWTLPRLADRSQRRLAAAALLVAAAAGYALAAEPAESDPRTAEVQQLVDRYFRSWSGQDMDRYGQCFMPQAAVQMIDDAGRLVTMPLTPFLRSQRDAHRTAPQPMVETPESVQIRFDGNLAHALVGWKLVAGDRVEYGYDHFTLMRSDGQWRIANLVFYTTPAPKDR